MVSEILYRSLIFVRKGLVVLGWFGGMYILSRAHAVLGIHALLSDMVTVCFIWTVSLIIHEMGHVLVALHGGVRVISVNLPFVDIASRSGSIFPRVSLTARFVGKTVIEGKGVGMHRHLAFLFGGCAANFLVSMCILTSYLFFGNAHVAPVVALINMILAIINLLPGGGEVTSDGDIICSLLVRGKR